MATWKVVLSKLSRSGLLSAWYRKRKATRTAQQSDIARTQPLLTVIMPAYNVAEYIRTSVSSVLGQSGVSLELIIVDDGSTDDTGDVIDLIAAEDSRVRVIHTVNQGPGAARNLALERATGKYIAFADSDDLIYPGAYRAMIRSLESSGSDLVTGPYRRGTDNHSRVPQWIKRVYGSTRTDIRLHEAPELVQDVISCNKMFRRDFLKEIGFRYPEGVYYEDQVAMTHAYLNAEKIDIISKKVYLWRVRDDQSSITQQKASLNDIIDRIDALLSSQRLVMDHGDPRVEAAWIRKLLDHDLPSYYPYALSGPDEYWDRLVGSFERIGAAVSVDALLNTPAYHRFMAWHLLHGQRIQFAELMEFHERGNPSLRRIRDREGLRFQLPDSMRASLPDELTVVTAADIVPVSQLQHLEFSGGRLHMGGFAFLRGIDTQLDEHKLIVRLVDDDAGETIECTVERSSNSRANLRAARLFEDYSDSGFSASVALADLVSDGNRSTSWRLELEQRAGGYSIRTGITEVDRTGSPGLGLFEIFGGALIRLNWRSLHATIEVTQDWAVLRETDHDDGSVDGALPLSSSAPPLQLSLRSKAGSVRLPAPDILDFTQLTKAVLEHDHNALYAKVSEGKAVGVQLGPGSDVIEAPDGKIRFVRPDSYSGGAVATQKTIIVVNAITVDDERLKISGEIFGDQPVSLRFQGDDLHIDSHPHVGSGRFTTEFVFAEAECRIGVAGMPIGVYTLSPLDPAVTILVPGVELCRQEKVYTVTQHGEWVAQCRRSDIQFRLASQSSSHLSRYAQRRSLESGWRKATTGLRDAVLLETHVGESIGGNPLAIGEGLKRRASGLKVFVSVVDRSLPVPEGFTPLIRYSPQWYEALGTSKYLVGDNHFPQQFEKQPGQVYLQTWHGTPLKKIAWDVHNKRLVADAYLRQISRESRVWDYLISQNPLSTRVFPGAFRYRGEILETGYPRNDLLLSPSASESATRIRTALGIPPSARVILYAPTWRDSPANLEREPDPYLDPTFLAEQVPDAVVLVRAHMRMSSLLPDRFVRHDRVMDVSKYPSISDLLLVSDQLITDYSSLMFDYSVLERPIYLYMPDLIKYRDFDRGFYFDIESMAPGPIFFDADRLTSSLATNLQSSAADRVAFRREFNPHDDGMSTDRVLDAVFADYLD